MWNVVPPLCPSILPRQIPMTQDAVPAVRHAHRSMCVGMQRRANEHTQKGTGIHMCSKSKFSITLCQHYTTAFSLHVFVVLWAMLSQIWWLAVCGYKKKSHSFQPRPSSLEAYWLIHHLVNMDFFFLPVRNLNSNSSDVMPLPIDAALHWLSWVVCFCGCVFLFVHVTVNLI